MSYLFLYGANTLLLNSKKIVLILDLYTIPGKTTFLEFDQDQKPVSLSNGI